MKRFIFFSDLHGSASAFRLAEEQIRRFEPAQIFLLGDLLYHGPRNPLPSGYAPQELVSLLNRWKEQICAVRGNCDAEVDQMLLDFPMMGDYAIVFDGERKMFLTHGHLQTPETMPSIPVGSVFVSGHTHIPVCEMNAKGILLFNPGSISLPKGGLKPSFGLCEEGVFSVRSLQSGELLLSL